MIPTEKNNKLQELANKLGYEYKNIKLLDMALRHRSVGNNNNERLEFLGDSILNFIIADILYHKFSKMREGDLSRIRAHLVKGETLSEIGIDYNLSNYLILGPGELKSGGYNRKSIISDVIEAIIASIYEDGGIDNCRLFIEKIFKQRLSKLTIKNNIDKDCKTRLQELLQSRKYDIPEYSIISVNGVAHEQIFTVSCYVLHLKTKYEATDTTRRKAEQRAAEKALLALGKRLNVNK